MKNDNGKIQERLSQVWHSFVPFSDPSLAPAVFQVQFKMGR